MISVCFQGKPFNITVAQVYVPTSNTEELKLNGMKRQNNMTLKCELPRSIGALYATGEEWRNSSRRNEETEPKHKPSSDVDVSSGQVNTNAVENNIG